MKRRFEPRIYAIDFGTSNSLLAAADPSTSHPPIVLDEASPEPTMLRSILFFPDSTRCFFGAHALGEYVASGMQGRLMRSIKRFLPSRNFAATQVGFRKLALEDLIGGLLGEMKVRADRYFETEVDRVVLGRPAVFSTDPEEDRLAEARLERAAHIAGFREVHFCPEPIAAAHDYRRVLTESKIALVADFGGGTSDFTVIRLRPDGYEASDVLSIGGVSIAGDALDGALMRHHVAVHFGARVTYKVPLGANVLTMPRSLMEKLCSPAEICLLSKRDILSFLRDVQSWSLGPDDDQRVGQLLCLVEDALGFQVFEAIERTKRALSDTDTAPFQFTYPTIEIEQEITRRDFQSASAREAGAILKALDDTVRAAGVRPEDIDVVCSTGGTAKVPAIARGLEDRFDRRHVRELRTFHSVIQGLAERARALA